MTDLELRIAIAVIGSAFIFGALAWVGRRLDDIRRHITQRRLAREMGWKSGWDR